jgi:hypothetical protein
LKAACIHQGWRFNDQTGRCIKPTQAKADCEARGPNYTYDLDTGGCVKHIGQAETQGASEQAEEQSSSEHSSDDSYDDHHHKKKKKRHHD